MAKGDIDVKKSESIFDELDRLHQAVSRRAYDLFRNGGTWGGALADWLTAEHELISKPAIELRQKDNQFEILVALPGVDAKDIDVQVTPENVLIKVETTEERTTDKGTVHLSEFVSAKIFRSIPFPNRVDPDSAKADYKNGMLRLTAAIAKVVTAKQVDIKAA